VRKIVDGPKIRRNWGTQIKNRCPRDRKRTQRKSRNEEKKSFAPLTTNRLEGKRKENGGPVTMGRVYCD